MEELYVSPARLRALIKICPSLVVENSLTILEANPFQLAVTKATPCLPWRLALEFVVAPPLRC